MLIRSVSSPTNRKRLEVTILRFCEDRSRGRVSRRSPAISRLAVFQCSFYKSIGIVIEARFNTGSGIPASLQIFIEKLPARALAFSAPEEDLGKCLKTLTKNRSTNCWENGRKLPIKTSTKKVIYGKQKSGFVMRAFSIVTFSFQSNS